MCVCLQLVISALEHAGVEIVTELLVSALECVGVEIVTELLTMLMLNPA